MPKGPGQAAAEPAANSTRQSRSANAKAEPAPTRTPALVDAFWEPIENRRAKSKGRAKRTLICRRQELERWYKARAANVDRNY